MAYVIFKSFGILNEDNIFPLIPVWVSPCTRIDKQVLKLAFLSCCVQKFMILILDGGITVGAIISSASRANINT